MDDARPWLMARWKAHGRLSVCFHWTLFAICYGSGIMRRNVYSSAVFTGSRPLCIQILPRQFPINHSWHQITKDWVPNGEDCIPLRFLVLTQYESVTDRQTDGYAIAYTALCKASFVARCKNCLQSARVLWFCFSCICIKNAQFILW